MLGGLCATAFGILLALVQANAASLTWDLNADTVADYTLAMADINSATPC